MGILTSLVRTEARATLGPLPLTAARILELFSGDPTAAGLTISVQGSLKLAAVWACVRVISEDVASLPLLLYRRLDKGKERVPQHPLYRLLHDQPNEFMTAMQFRETLQGHVLTWGNAYANIERDGDGRPVALWPLRPDQMNGPVLSQGGTLLYTYYLPSGEPRALTQAEVFHLRGLSSDGIIGYSPIQFHRESLALSLATMKFGNLFFGSGSQPSGVLQVKTKLSKEGADRLRDSWNAAHQGLERSHRVAVLEEGVEWKQIGIPPEDSQFLETRQFQVQETTRIFRMPPHKVQDLSRATYSNIEEQAIEYVSDTLRPWLTRWEQQINKDLIMPGEQKTIFAEHLMDALLRGKTLERFESYAKGIGNGIYSPNDVLELENRNPYEGGDVHLQPLNMIPIGSPPPAPAPAKRMVRELERTENGYRLIEQEVADGQL